MKSKIMLLSLLIMIVALLSYQYTDLDVACYFHALDNPKLKSIFSHITILGQAEYTLVPALFVYLYYKKSDILLALKARYIFVSVAASGITVLLLKMFFGRFRPELYFQKKLFGFDFFHINHTMTSFPSGHSTTAMSASIAVGMVFPKLRVPFFVLALLIMISRVVIMRHYPSDVLVGGLLGGLMSWAIYEYFFKERLEHV